MRRLARRLVSSVRVRITLTALLAVGGALGVAAYVANAGLNHDRQRVLLATATEEAHQVEAFNPGFGRHLALPSDATVDLGLIQVLYKGRILGSSPGLPHQPLWQPGDPVVQGPSSGLGFLPRDTQIVEVPLTSRGVQVNVMVVISLTQYDHTVADVRHLLDAGAPMVLAVVGLICWLVVGRALRPIEMMRREVAEVASISDAHRVAEPATDDEVGRLARTLNSMLARIQASSDRERRFVSDASHELRSPIANIRTELEVALHHPETADWFQVAAEVLAQNERMEALVAGLLLLARSDEGSLIEAAEPTDLLAVATGVVAELPSGPPAVEVGGRPALVRVPAVYLERLVFNLVDNARRFAVSRVAVGVTLDPARGCAELRVRDDGPGVAVVDRTRIFERFVRVDAARDRGEGGFGLGLAIVADLCRFYGGSVEVADGSPGAEFVVRLPAAWRQEPAVLRPAVARVPGGAGPRPATPNPHISEL